MPHSRIGRFRIVVTSIDRPVHSDFLPNTDIAQMEVSPNFAYKCATRKPVRGPTFYSEDKFTSTETSGKVLEFCVMNRSPELPNFQS